MRVPRWTWPLFAAAVGGLATFAAAGSWDNASLEAALASGLFAGAVGAAAVRLLPNGAALIAAAAASMGVAFLSPILAPRDLASLALVSAIVALPSDLVGTPAAVPRTLAAIGAYVLEPVTGLVALAVLPWMERDRLGVALLAVAAVVVLASPLEPATPGRAASTLYVASAFLVARLLARPAEAHPFSSRAGARAAAALPALALLTLILWRREEIVPQALTGALAAAIAAALLGVVAVVLALGFVLLFATRSTARLPTAAMFSSSLLGIAFLGPAAAWAAIVPLLWIAGVGLRALPRLVSPSMARPTQP